MLASLFNNFARYTLQMLVSRLSAKQYWILGTQQVGAQFVTANETQQCSLFLCKLSCFAQLQPNPSGRVGQLASRLGLPA